MTFLEIQEKSLARVDETIDDADNEVLSVIKDAINNGYMLLASLVDKRFTTVTMALDDYDNKLPLPLDYSEFIMAEHETVGQISHYDYEELGNVIHFKNKDLVSGDVTITYFNYPSKLVNNTDELRLKEVYLGALTAYTAYVYQLYKKKYAAAQMLLQEFNTYIPTKNPPIITN